MAQQGVVYLDMDTVREYEDMVREYFMSLVPPHDHSLRRCTAQFGLVGPLYMCRLVCMWKCRCSRISGPTHLVLAS